MFGEVTIAPTVQQDSWHAYATSKIVRVGLWFSNEGTEMHVPLFTLLSAPAEHLMLVLQKRDEQGSVLRDIYSGGQNPFFECMSSYADMVLHPRKALEVFIHHIEPKGPLYTWVVMQCVMSCALGMMGIIWRDLSEYYLTWPYKLVGLAWVWYLSPMSLKHFQPKMHF